MVWLWAQSGRVKEGELALDQRACVLGRFWFQSGSVHGRVGIACLCVGLYICGFVSPCVCVFLCVSVSPHVYFSTCHSLLMCSVCLYRYVASVSVSVSASLSVSLRLLCFDPAVLRSIYAPPCCDDCSLSRTVHLLTCICVCARHLRWRLWLWIVLPHFLVSHVELEPLAHSHGRACRINQAYTSGEYLGCFNKPALEQECSIPRFDLVFSRYLLSPDCQVEVVARGELGQQKTAEKVIESQVLL